MPYAFHADPRKKWQQQYVTTKRYILPFILEHHDLPPGGKVLEIGCAEGGALKAFAEAGYSCHGVDISASRLEQAKKLTADELATQQISFYAGDAVDSQTLDHLTGEIDLILLKDTIEHIHDQEKFLTGIHKLIKRDGIVFLAFPPWFNPFGGHQQLARSVLRFLPWFHLLPQSFYRGILKLFGETDALIKGLLEIRDTRLTIRRFEELLSRTRWRVIKRQFYLFNPVYELKFGIKGRRQFGWISQIPVVRDFISTGVYYLVR